MPKNNTRNTKDVIISVALRLFSERGYEGVGIRDIAKEIGIRESALYKHFSSKQDIFDSILGDIEYRYQERFEEYVSEGKDTREELFRHSLSMFQFYLQTEYGSRFRRMLTAEQYRDSKAGDFFRDLILDDGLQYITKVFTKLIKEGVYVDADPAIMALQFYSPLYVLLCRYDNQPDKYEEAVALLEKHIMLFNNMYSRRISL